MCRACRTTPAAANTPSPAQAPPAPDWTPGADLGPRGRALWDQMADAGLSPPERVLLEEACRAADRLDRLAAFLRGREDMWLRFWRNDEGTTVKVVVDRALSEVRQQADSLRGIVAELVRKQAGKPEAEEPKESILDELARRRSNRQQEAAGS